MLRRLLGILFCLLSLLGPVSSQPRKTVLYSYLQNIRDFNALFPQEKVYLHFDNTGYFMGETIWFKAYIFRDDLSMLTDLSKVLYVELVSPDGEVQSRQILKISDGTASGSIPLDKLLFSGFYEVRAYTRYMTNWGNAGIFSRVFPVFNAPSDPESPSCVIDDVSYRNRLPDAREAEPSERKASVSFYPEGGHLVSGMENRMAFCVSDRGQALPSLHCALVVGRDTLTTMTTNQFGYGVFSYFPVADDAELFFKDSRGAPRRFPLPKAEDTGCVMRINTLDDSSVKMEVEGTEGFIGRRLAVVVLSRGNIIGVDTLTVEPGGVVREMKKSDLMDGVNEFALISSEGHVLSDRMVFCYPQLKPSAITASVLTPRMEPCRRVGMKFTSVPNTAFSVSVRDYDREINGGDGDIYSWLLLSSDLKGYVSQPGYYLESDDREHRMNADLLMLVQGWRRYDVGTMLGRKPFFHEQPMEKGLTLHGQIHARKPDFPVSGRPVSITMYNRYGQVMDGKADTDSCGYFSFQVPDAGGEWTMFVNLRNKKENKKYYVSLDRHFSPACRHLSAAETTSLPRTILAVEAQAGDSGKVEYGPMERHVHMIPTVKVRAKYLFKDARKSWESEKRGAYAASICYNCEAEADKIADAGMDQPGIFDWLKSRNTFFSGTAGRMNDTKAGSGETDSIQVDEFDRKRWDPDYGKKTDGQTTSYAFNRGGDGKYYDPEIAYGHYLLMERDGLSYKNRPVVWILNNSFYYVSYAPTSWKLYDIQGIPAPTYELMPESLDDFKSVYISEDANIWRRYINMPKMEGAAPVTVFLYSHHRGKKEKGCLRRTHYQGYAVPQVFEMPDYSVMPESGDFRRTLYWNPDVVTDKDGEATVEFYNNSSCQRLAISAEGITREGQLVVY